MGLTVAQKILKEHLVDGSLTEGDEIGIKIDQTLTQDATGTMADLQFEQMGTPRVKTEVSVSYIDHKTIQMGFEDADDHTYLQTFAKKYGLYLSKAGNGICHQVHVERFGKPGKTLLGSDSHTPTGGGIGMIAIGAGGLDVASAMAGMPFYMPRPKIVGIKLTGKLNPWVSAKDIILKVLQILTTKGNVGWIAEYFGDGVKHLSVPERATITNMGAELGVTTSVFPSDETTRSFLKAQKREQDWISLEVDPDAVYDKVIEINLNELEPMIAQPHSPDNVVRVRDVEGTPADQVMVGSCTNSSYKDGKILAEILKGKVANENVSFGYAPGSKQVLRMLSDEGKLSHIIAAGARILESACGFCIGAGQAPRNNAVSIRTNNRNFFGRSGTTTAKIYLVSPETAAACALTGKITDPRDLEKLFGIQYPKVDVPSEFTIDDSLIIPPAHETGMSKVELYKGPNIVDPPGGSSMPADLIGEVTGKFGDKITTDDIMPAGDLLKYRSNVPKYAEYVFVKRDPTFAQRCLENKKMGIHNIIVGGDSYGQGSSREHAALCPMYLGVKAVIAKAIERIHRANLINFGILPLTFKNPDDYEKIDQGDRIKLPNIRKALIENKGEVMLYNETKGISIPLNYHLTEREVKTILAGGTMKLAKDFPGKSFKEIVFNS
ncbi:Aconitate hydratase [Desulfurella amilsii]|uniref:Aconitate hydratase n=1 Tax=Desulfurella amilsii TaxID=1562698 RepID=A0A1X4XXM4_9BACT|nr:aconitate hydratase [Desulfurella amilsii]OSS42287.1 Aconitate hydratase [Desulfurella amilsii]